MTVNDIPLAVNDLPQDIYATLPMVQSSHIPIPSKRGIKTRSMRDANPFKHHIYCTGRTHLLKMPDQLIVPVSLNRALGMQSILGY